MAPYTPLTDEQVKDFAKRIYRGEVFVSWSLPNLRHLASHFLPVALMSEEQRQLWISWGVTVFWAPMSSALPMGLNGFPVFSECGAWRREDADRVNARLTEIEELLK